MPEPELEDPTEPALQNDYDVVIIGAGLTGLSLACWLLQLAQDEQKTLPSVCLLEPRLAYHNDRTWCFWDLSPHPFRELITHRWSSWEVSEGDRSVRQSGGTFSYAMLPADVCYEYARSTIEKAPAMDLLLGITVDTVEQTDGAVVVEGPQGRWQAKAVIDTRPPAEHQLKSAAGFWQVFSGLQIACPDHGFETSTATLMNFQPSRTQACFVYQLPLDKDNLLVEWTAFQPGKVAFDYQSDLESWLVQQGLGGYQVTRSESGMLPMMPIAGQKSPGRVVRAGVGAGWMRAASGYHFASCQRGCEALARQILSAKTSGDWLLQPPRVRPRWLDWMDEVFLRAMKQHPEKTPEWFLELFATTTAEQMSRFMNDEPRLADAFAVANALPRGPFIRAAMPW